MIFFLKLEACIICLNIYKFLVISEELIFLMYYGLYKLLVVLVGIGHGEAHFGVGHSDLVP